MFLPVLELEVVTPSQIFCLCGARRADSRSKTARFLFRSAFCASVRAETVELKRSKAVTSDLRPSGGVTQVPVGFV